MSDAPLPAAPPAGAAQNPTLDLPCREVFARGQKAVQVWGPVPGAEAEITALHAGFWKRRPG